MTGTDADSLSASPRAPRVAAAFALGFVALTLAGWIGHSLALSGSVGPALRLGVQAGVMSGLVLIGLWLLLRYVDRRPLSDLAVLDFGRSLRGFVFGAGLIAAPYLVTVLCTALFGWATLSVNSAAGGLRALAIGLATAFFFEAFPEELLFRGYVFRNLSETMRTWRAGLLTALLFALVPVCVALTQRHVLGMDVQIGGQNHLTAGFVLTVFGFGCVLQYLRVVTGTVWTGIGFHLLFLVSNRIVGIRPSSFIVLSDVGAEGPMQLVLVASVLLMVFVAVRYPRSVLRAGLALALLAAPASAQTAGDSLQITLASNSAAERETAEQLRRLLREHRVDQWIVTRRIHIDERERVPHSHPVLTLNTRYLRDDHALLATFVHEQFHWLEDGNAAFREAMRAYALVYPDAPARGPEGGYNLESTHRHLLVCDLEFQAMSILVGAERAREVLASHRFYTWIYQRVLSDSTVRRIATEHGFVLKGTP